MLRYYSINLCYPKISISLQSLPQNNFVFWSCSENSFGIDVNIWWETCSRHLGDLELLHQPSEKDEEFFFCQRLSQAVSFSNPERNHSLIINELALGINEPVWIEHIWKEILVLFLDRTSLEKISFMIAVSTIYRNISSSKTITSCMICKLCD